MTRFMKSDISFGMGCTTYALFFWIIWRAESVVPDELDMRSLTRRAVRRGEASQPEVTDVDSSPISDLRPRTGPEKDCETAPEASRSSHDLLPSLAQMQDDRPSAEVQQPSDLDSVYSSAINDAIGICLPSSPKLSFQIVDATGGHWRDAQETRSDGWILPPAEDEIERYLQSNLVFDEIPLNFFRLHEKAQLAASIVTYGINGESGNLFYGMHSKTKTAYERKGYNLLLRTVFVLSAQRMRINGERVNFIGSAVEADQSQKNWEKLGFRPYGFRRHLKHEIQVKLTGGKRQYLELTAEYLPFIRMKAPAKKQLMQDVIRNARKLGIPVADYDTLVASDADVKTLRDYVDSLILSGANKDVDRWETAKEQDETLFDHVPEGEPESHFTMISKNSEDARKKAKNVLVDWFLRRAGDEQRKRTTRNRNRMLKKFLSMGSSLVRRKSSLCTAEVLREKFEKL